MKIIKCVAVCLFLAQSLAGQMNLHVVVQNFISYEVTWEKPSDNVAYYHLYKNGCFLSELTDTVYVDTVFFIYSNQYTVEAYTTDNQLVESESSTVVLSALYGYPFEVGFEGNKTLLASYAIMGQSCFQRDTVNPYEQSACVLFIGAQPGDSSILFTPPFYVTENNSKSPVKQSFYYRTPQQGGITDQLTFQCSNGTTIDVPPAEDWTYFDTIINQNESLVYTFSGKSMGGGGIYIDLIRFEQHVNILHGPMIYKELILYPNPATDVVNVLYPTGHPQNVTLAVYSVDGKRMFAGNYKISQNQHVKINTTGYHSGIYFVKVSGEKFVTTGRFIIE